VSITTTGGVVGAAAAKKKLQALPFVEVRDVFSLPLKRPTSELSWVTFEIRQQDSLLLDMPRGIEGQAKEDVDV
jgi:hypothetical protein